MDITQRFYDALAAHYDKLFLDWTASAHRQAAFLDALFRARGFDAGARLLDCACGIGTQAIGLAALGYSVAASDLSEGALNEAKRRAAENGVELRFERADFRALEAVFPEPFDLVIAMDNALPHMLSAADLEAAVGSIVGRLKPGGLFVASIRDYDALLIEKPRCTPPYIHETERGRRVSFQLWDWIGEHYHFTQYIIDDEGTPQIRRFDCEYRAVRREELTRLLLGSGCRSAEWLLPEDTDWYQPVVAAVK